MKNGGQRVTFASPPPIWEGRPAPPPESNASAITIYLGLGSNLGDRAANLADAAARIAALGLEIIRASSLYETEPVGYTDQPWFLNQALEVRMGAGKRLKIIAARAQADTETRLHAANKARSEALASAPQAAVSGVSAESAEAGHLPENLTGQLENLLAALLGIEREMGRVRTIQDGPRTIDLDLLMAFTAVGVPITHRASDGSLIVPHPRMHLRRFVLIPLCEIAPALKHPTTGETCEEMLGRL